MRAIEMGVGVGELLDGDIDQRLLAAHDDFATADRLLSNAVLEPVRWLPVAGRQLRSAAALSETARKVLGASTDALGTLRSELDQGSPTGAERVRALERLLLELRAVDDVLQAVDLGPDDALVTPLHQARVEVLEQLTEARVRIEDVLTVADGLHSLLQGPTTYLVVAANNAEMRVGSGMFLSIGTMDVDEGEVRVGTDFTPAGEIVLAERLPIPRQIDRLWGWTTIGSDYRDLGLSARFPVNAAIASDMWSASGGAEIDGVLMIDVDGIAALLRIGGPVEIDGRQIGADEVVPYLLEEQYELVERGDEATNAERRDRLRTLASAALELFGTSELDFRELLEQLREARDGRHLMAWSPQEGAMAAWQTLGVDGDLDQRSLLVGLANFDGSKLDPFVDMAVEVEQRQEGDVAVIDMAITITNGAPDGLPPYAAGPERETYTGVVAAHLPGSATDVELSGFDGLTGYGRDGPSVVISAPTEVPRGTTRQGNLRFRIPLDVLDDVTVVSSARIPAVAWRVGGARWADDSPREWPPHDS